MAPSSFHWACCWRRAWVGMICWSGGRRGSTLYIVASQGGSPSGRLTAVRGRSASPALVAGRWLGEVVAPGETPGFVDPETLRAGVTLRDAAVAGEAELSVLADFVLLGEPVLPASVDRLASAPSASSKRF